MATGTSYRTPGMLPPLTSGFIGRVAELARVRELLREPRLVTITGAGGVGKSRLAARVAGEAADGFRDGVHLIELSGVRDPGLLMCAVAAELTLAELSNAESDQGSQLDTVLGFIRDRELLLILDTCEHLVDACAALADTILRAAPAVTILATSRQPLEASGEAVLQLFPLPVPDPGEESAGKADVVELFAQRAVAAVPGFTVTPENLADVITVCRRLDGIPLAIELATVRLRALPLRQMAERIDDRLRLLTGGRPTDRATTRAVARRRPVPAGRKQWKGEDAGQVGNEGAAIVLATSLFVYWRISGLLREAEYRLDQALERCPKGSVVRARVLSTRGYVRTLLGDFANGRADAEAAIEMAAVFSDLAAAGRAHSALHRLLTYGGHLAEAQAAADAAASCLTSVGDTLALAQLDLVDALLRLREGELDLCDESVTRGLDRLPEDEVWYTGAPAFEALHRVAERVARNRLGEDRFWELHAAGAAAPLDHAIERALGDDDQLGDPAEQADSVE